jgi:hypothetical protein
VRGAIVLLLSTGCQVVFPLDAPKLEDAGLDAAPPDAPIPGLVAHYRMEDTPLGTLPDVASGNDGVCITGQCPMMATGQLDGGLAFDGFSSRIRLPDGPALALPEFTITFWIEAELGRMMLQCVVGRPFGTSNANSWSICLDPADHVLFASLNDPTALLHSNTVAGLPLDPGFHHVAARWSGTDRQLFIDGAIAGETLAITDPIRYDVHDVVLGADADGGTTQFFVKAVIDDLRIYDRALSNAELATLATP